MARGSRTRLTTDETSNANPLWHPDGRLVAFRSERNGQPAIQHLYPCSAENLMFPDQLAHLDESSGCTKTQIKQAVLG